MKISQRKVKTILIRQWNYPLKQVDSVVNKLFNMSEDIFQSFVEWIDTGIMPDTPVIQLFSPKRILETYGMKPPACFMLLDWIRREPVEALASLKDEFKRDTPLDVQEIKDPS